MIDTDEKTDSDERYSPLKKPHKTDSDKFDEMVEQGFSPEEIAEMEQSAINGAIEDRTTSSDSAPEDEKNFFKEEESTGRGRFSFTGRKRRRAIVGGLGIGLVASGSFVFFSFISGPLQFIQISKLLQQFHFSSQEDASDDRFMRIARYIRYKGDQRTRLGTLGNKVADSIETRLARAGLQSSYGLASFQDGYIINAGNIPASSELSDLNNKSFPEQQKILSEKFSVPLDNIKQVNGRLFVGSEGLGYFKEKKLMRIALQEAGYSKIGSAIRTRIMGKRAGWNWRPIKKLDRLILTTADARLKEWQKTRENEIKNGADQKTTLRAGTDQDSDGDGIKDSTSQQVKDATDAANNPGAPDPDIDTPANTPDADVANIKGKLLGKAGATSAVLGLLCLAKSLADNVDNVKHANVVLPLMRLGGEGLTVGNQIMTDNDVNTEQLGFLAKKLYSEEDGSWREARSIQAELNEKLTGPDINPEARLKKEKNVVSEVLGKIPALGTACSVINSTIGFIVTSALDVLGGPVGAAITTAFGATLGPKIIDGFARWLAGKPIDINVAGANYGNYINYGARLAANDSIIASGGRKLSRPEALELRQYRLQDQKEIQQSKTFLARLFDPTDATSPVGDFISRQSPNPRENLSQFARTLPRTLSSIIPSLGQLISNKATAAPDPGYDYGFDLYGFSVEELNNPEFNNPQENAEKAFDILNRSDNDYRERALNCFGINFVTVNNTLAVRSAGKVPAYHQIPDDKCVDSNLDWKRVRFFIFDSQMMESYACFNSGLDGSCSEFGLDGTPSGGATSPYVETNYPITNTENMSCPVDPNIVDAGVADGYESGVQYKIRLCSVYGVDINTIYAKNFLDFFTAFKNAGYDLTRTNGFRSMADQIKLRSERCPDTYNSPSSDCQPPTAKPGTSNHQYGVAADIVCNGHLLGDDVGNEGVLGTDNFEAASLVSPCLAWVRQNSPAYGLLLNCDKKNLGNSATCESWHLSPDGS